ncbi:MAG TPA: hypothetical protein VEY12_04960 [Thermoplasmata archaeon]|nr:hypothetical protein [Thermoplasmata archaeon]
MRSEVHQDWTLVRHYADRAFARMAAPPSGGPPAPPPIPGQTGSAAGSATGPESLVTVAKIMTYLDAASEEPNFARAWIYVNSADALLPLVVPDEDIWSCEQRLGLWDTSLPKPLADRLTSSPQAQRVQEILDILHPKPAPQAQGHAGTPPPPPPPPPPSPPVSEIRKAVHEKMQVRAQCWNEANHQVVFTGNLWLWAGFGVLIALGISITIAEWIVASNPTTQWMRFHFVGAAFLGLFGGALSAYLGARDVVISIPRYQLIVIHTALRMLIGAAGAFVVITAALALPLGSLSTLVGTNPFAFVLAGIAAGFSERLFVDTLEKAAKNLGTISSVGDLAPAGKGG